MNTCCVYLSLYLRSIYYHFTKKCFIIDKRCGMYAQKRSVHFRNATAARCVAHQIYWRRHDISVILRLIAYYVAAIIFAWVYKCNRKAYNVWKPIYTRKPNSTNLTFPFSEKSRFVAIFLNLCAVTTIALQMEGQFCTFRRKRLALVGNHERHRLI